MLASRAAVDQNGRNFSDSGLGFPGLFEEEYVE